MKTDKFPKCAKDCEVIKMLGAGECESVCPQKFDTNIEAVLSSALVNNNELMLPINFKALAAEHGVRKGTIFYSNTCKSWVIQGHHDIDLICIDAPLLKGQNVEGLKGKASRFNGKAIQNVVIRSNMWCAIF